MTFVFEALKSCNTNFEKDISRPGAITLTHLIRVKIKAGNHFQLKKIWVKTAFLLKRKKSVDKVEIWVRSPDIFGASLFVSKGGFV